MELQNGQLEWMTQPQDLVEMEEVQMEKLVVDMLLQREQLQLLVMPLDKVEVVQNPEVEAVEASMEDILMQKMEAAVEVVTLAEFQPLLITV